MTILDFFKHLPHVWSSSSDVAYLQLCQLFSVQSLGQLTSRGDWQFCLFRILIWYEILTILILWNQGNNSCFESCMKYFLQIIIFYGFLQRLSMFSSWKENTQIDKNVHFTLLYCTILNCTVLYCTVLYCTVLYCTVLYCTVLFCSVLFCTVLYCTAIYFSALPSKVLH